MSREAAQGREATQGRDPEQGQGQDSASGREPAQQHYADSGVYGRGPADKAAGPAGRVFRQRGMYFDELEVGDEFEHAPGRTITEADNVAFTTMTMNSQALHLDAHWAQSQPFGQRLVNSMLTLATLVGASVTQLTQGTLVANLGFEEVEFPHPLYHGDTLYTRSRITAKRPSRSRPGQGIVTVEHIGTNQEGAVVARCVRSGLFWESTHEAGHESAHEDSHE